MKICLTTEINNRYKPVAEITHQIISDYCQRHSYDFSVWDKEEWERDVVWDRVRHIQSKLPDYDWVVHIDSDCLITNHHIPLEEFIDNNKSIVISCAPYQGELMFNDGFVMVKNDDFGAGELKCWWNKENWIDFPEVLCPQDAAWKMYSQDAYIRSHYSIQPQKRFNSFLWNEYPEENQTQGNWTPGDFLLHLPGMTTEKRVSLLNQYKEMILR